MRMLALFAILVGPTLLVAAPVPKSMKKRPDGSEVLGTWQMVRYEIKGSPGGASVKDLTWRFEPDGKAFAVFIESGSETPMWYRFDTDGVEWRTKADAAPALGSYKVDGDMLYLVHAYEVTDPRPTEFAPGERVFYAEFRRDTAKK